MRVVLAVRVIFHVDKQCRDQFPAVVAAVSIFPVVQNTHDTRPFRRQSTVKWSTEGSKGRTRDQQIGFDAKGMYGYLKVEWCFFFSASFVPGFPFFFAWETTNKVSFSFREKETGGNELVFRHGISGRKWDTNGGGRDCVVFVLFHFLFQHVVGG